MHQPPFDKQPSVILVLKKTRAERDNATGIADKLAERAKAANAKVSEIDLMKST